MERKPDRDSVRHQNRSHILAALRKRGHASRTALGRDTGLSPATVSAIMADMIEEGLIVERAPINTHTGTPSQNATPIYRARGRPRIAMSLNPDHATLLAAKISVDRCTFLLSDYAGQTIAQSSITLPTLAAKRGAYAGSFIAAAEAFLRNHPASRRPDAIAIAMQGLVNGSTGTIAWSPAFSERDIPFTAPVSAHFGVQTMLSNDANMMAFGLKSTYPARFGDTFIAVMLDRGVGAGLFINGMPFEGATGAAAEFGHANHMPDGPLCRCGRRGCLEAFLSDYGIWRMASETPQNDRVITPSEADYSALIERARTGDARARAAFEEAGRALGFGIARLSALFDPGHVVISGAGIAAWDLIGAACEAGLEDTLVGELRGRMRLSVEPWSRNFILEGARAAALAYLDADVFAVPPELSAHADMGAHAS